MFSHPDSVRMLADIRHREVQEEIARYRLVREAYGDGPAACAAFATACRQLGAVLVRARQHLELIGWTLTVHRRGAFPR